MADSFSSRNVTITCVLRQKIEDSRTCCYAACLVGTKQGIVRATPWKWEERADTRVADLPFTSPNDAHLHLGKVKKMIEGGSNASYATHLKTNKIGRVSARRYESLLKQTRREILDMPFEMDIRNPQRKIDPWNSHETWRALNVINPGSSQRKAIICPKLRSKPIYMICSSYANCALIRRKDAFTTEKKLTAFRRPWPQSHKTKTTLLLVPKALDLFLLLK